MNTELPFTKNCECCNTEVKWFRKIWKICSNSSDGTSGFHEFSPSMKVRDDDGTVVCNKCARKSGKTRRKMKQKRY